MHKVLVIVGSLREGSLNAKLAGVLEKLAEGRLEFEYADLTDLPLYNDDLWSDVPEAVTRLKASVEAADGVLFVTPEYNRTFPGLIANVIHWASRPYGKNSWGGKPVAITGTSPGVIGTAAAQALLRSVLVSVGTVLMGQPELYFAFKDGLVDDDLNVTNEETEKFLANWIGSFADWIEKHG
ncbi:MAG: NADPH-dependent FMN reductase [Rhizobiales bacterium]|nr:NADPH-dependent FMN reductase [Hyphomicrobiales bacterium]MBA70265.1 NADPH-dependent FMN reductase [Hyphomicrobiales bacterium]|tara:strand:- start:2186 stop:2731 length:546 start_codon:yes stop_codon:yes gene_type:complete